MKKEFLPHPKLQVNQMVVINGMVLPLEQYYKILIILETLFKEEVKPQV
ncbi:MAG TPA: hypothetical protein VIK77_06530 [Tissierellaceae bacterium]